MTRFLKRLNILYERLLMLLLNAVFLIAVWCVYDNWYVYKHSDTVSSRLLRFKPGITAVAAADDGSPSISEDMVAWLTIDGTDIDYPIMQAGDNIKYLNTDPFGEYSLAGSIFLDSRNAPDMSDPYSLVYGHHMERGRMFGALDPFLGEEYLRSHDSGTLIIGRNAEKTCRLEVFAAMRADARSKELFEPDITGDVLGCIRGSADIFINERRERILALSTCADDAMLSRTIVFCYILE